MKATSQSGSQEMQSNESSGSPEKLNTANKVLLKSWRKQFGLGSKKSSRNAFKDWLKGLTKTRVQRFRRASEGFFNNLPATWRKMLKDRIAELDPEVLSENRSKIIRLKKAERLEKRLRELPSVDELEKTRIAVELSIKNNPTPSKIKFVSRDGISKVIGICLAAGYSYDDVSEFFGIQKEDIMVLVPQEKVYDLVREVPNAIINMADQKVARDLLVGNLSKDTEVADRISSRRKKLVLDAMDEKRKTEEHDSKNKEDREKNITDSFGEV